MPCLIVTSNVGADVTIDHRDPFGSDAQWPTAMDDHVAVNGNSATQTRPFDAHTAVSRRSFATLGERRNFSFGSDEVLKVTAIEQRRVGDHHHVVKGECVVMPFVHS